MKVSVLILTLDEEKNLPMCLKSLAWCDDIVILDSKSKDKTEQIAKKVGARVIQRRFDNYSNQRNYGLNQVDYKNSWLFMVDADETVHHKLAQEIINLPENEGDICIYRMRRKDYFMGKWIKHSSGYPTWFGRLLKIGRTWVERSINEEYHTEGNIGNLKHHLMHYPFNKGFESWISKHNRYSSLEAEKKVNNSGFVKVKFGRKELFDPVERRKIIKGFVYKLPARPLLIFFALYFYRLGFLDGRPGLTFCTLRAFYEYMIDCKVREKKIRAQNLPL